MNAEERETWERLSYVKPVLADFSTKEVIAMLRRRLAEDAKENSKKNKPTK